MRTRLLALLAALAALLMLTGPANAMSIVIGDDYDQGDDTCVPWPGQEYVPPTTEEQPNPEYVPGWTETIEHPAVYETVHHDATYAVEHQYMKQVKGVVQKKSLGIWWDVDTFGWEAWSGGTTKWSESDVAVLESGPHSAVQATWSEGWKDYRKVTTHYRFVPTGETRQGRMLTEAYDEQVLVTPAWTETIEHPAIGEPTIIVVVDPGQEYVPPVTCPEPEPTDPPVAPEPTPGPTPEPAPAPAPAAAPVAAAPAFTG